MINLIGHCSSNLTRQFKNESYKAIGLFSQGIYLANNLGSYVMLHDIKYGLIPFGIGIKNFKEIFSSLNLDTNTDFVFNDNSLLIIDKDINVLNIDINIDDYSTYINKNIDNNEFIKIGLNEVINSNKGLFSKILNNIDTNDIYIKNIKKYFKDEILNKENCVEFLNNMIGLGPGLTPSGDDFISGYLYVKLHNNDDIEISNIMIEFIKEYGYKLTNSISMIYLNSIIDRQRFSLYDDVIYANNSLELINAIRNLIEVGSNSGSDILCGMIYAKMH